MWGREMRAGLVFVLVSLLAGGAYREWRREHEERFADLIATLERGSRASESSTGPPALGPDPVRAPRDASPRARPGAGSARPGAAGASAVPLAPSAIDIDRAAATELERLPGIGPSLAARIVADRAVHGAFLTPEALLRVPGIGPRILARIRPFLTAPAPADSGSPNAN